MIKRIVPFYQVNTNMIIGPVTMAELPSHVAGPLMSVTVAVGGLNCNVSNTFNLERHISTKFPVLLFTLQRENRLLIENLITAENTSRPHTGVYSSEEDIQKAFLP